MSSPDSDLTESQALSSLRLLPPTPPRQLGRLPGSLGIQMERLFGGPWKEPTSPPKSWPFSPNQPLPPQAWLT